MKRPILLLIISYFAGLIVVGVTGIAIVPGITVVLITFITLSAVFSKKKKVFYALLCVFFFLLGIFRYSSAVTPGAGNICNFVSEEPERAVLYGIVASPGEHKGKSFRERFVFQIKAERLLIDGEEHKVTGGVQIDLYSLRKKPALGNRLVIGGKIFLPKGESGPDGFDYKAYLKRNSIYAVMRSSEDDYFLKVETGKNPIMQCQRFLSEARTQTDRLFTKYLHGQTRDITRSIVLGLRSTLTKGTTTIFRRTGTMHILAVSGLHIGVVALMLMGSLKLIKCPKMVMCFLVIAGICSFAVFTGARTSSIRAAIMASFLLVGLAMEWRVDIINTLILSAFIITFFLPGQLFQPGFILSYTAVLSIIYITPVTDRMLRIVKGERFESRMARIRRYALKSVSVSVAVWIGMAPVIAAYFNIVTPSVILSNLVAIPMLIVVIGLGFSLALVGAVKILVPIAFAVSGILNFLIPLFLKTLRDISSVPFSFIEVPTPNWLFIAGYYAVLAGGLVRIRSNWYARQDSNL